MMNYSHSIVPEEGRLEQLERERAEIVANLDRTVAQMAVLQQDRAQIVAEHAQIAADRDAMLQQGRAQLIAEHAQIAADREFLSQEDQSIHDRLDRVQRFMGDVGVHDTRFQFIPSLYKLHFRDIQLILQLVYNIDAKGFEKRNLTAKLHKKLTENKVRPMNVTISTPDQTRQYPNDQVDDFWNLALGNFSKRFLNVTMIGDVLGETMSDFVDPDRMGRNVGLAMYTGVNTAYLVHGGRRLRKQLDRLGDLTDGADIELLMEISYTGERVEMMTQPVMGPFPHGNSDDDDDEGDIIAPAAADIIAPIVDSGHVDITDVYPGNTAVDMVEFSTDSPINQIVALGAT